MKIRTFKCEINNNSIELAVRSPSLQDQQEASKVYNQAFNEAIKSKAIVRARLDDLLYEQGLWDTIKQNQFSTLQHRILEGEKKLAKGGIPLAEARTIALKMRQDREEMRDLIAVKTNLDTHTAEGQADNARFNYLVSVCTVYNDSKQPYFKTYADYLNSVTDTVAILAAQNLAGMLYGLDADFEEKLSENKFLKQYKFIDSKLRLINKNGHLVDEENRLIDEFGRFVNDDGKLIDKDGNLVSDDGDYLLEFSPFLDENGQPVSLDNNSNNETKEEEIETNKSEEIEIPA